MPIGNSVTVTNTPTLIAAAAERKAIIVSNVGAATVYLSLSGDANVTDETGAKSGHPLAPGARVVLSREDRRSIVPNQAIYGITASNCKVAVETIP